MIQVALNFKDVIQVSLNLEDDSLNGSFRFGSVSRGGRCGCAKFAEVLFFEREF